MFHQQRSRKKLSKSATWEVSISVSSTISVQGNDSVKVRTIRSWSLVVKKKKRPKLISGLWQDMKSNPSTPTATSFLANKLVRLWTLLDIYGRAILVEYMNVRLGPLLDVCGRKLPYPRSNMGLNVVQTCTVRTCLLKKSEVL